MSLIPNFLKDAVGSILKGADKLYNGILPKPALEYSKQAFISGANALLDITMGIFPVFKALGATLKGLRAAGNVAYANSSKTTDVPTEAEQKMEDAFFENAYAGIAKAKAEGYEALGEIGTSTLDAGLHLSSALSNLAAASTVAFVEGLKMANSSTQKAATYLPSFDSQSSKHFAGMDDCGIEIAKILKTLPTISL